MGDFSTATGAVTFTMMILSRYIFKYFGWGTAALITPTVLLITGIAFFSLVLFRWGLLLLLVGCILLCCVAVYKHGPALRMDCIAAVLCAVVLCSSA
jgi:ATP/ADP translocase